MASRIYYVAMGDTEKLVRAAHPAQALMHLARTESVVRVATQDDIVSLVRQDIQVEDAGNKEQSA